VLFSFFTEVRAGVAGVLFAEKETAVEQQRSAEKYQYEFEFSHLNVIPSNESPCSPVSLRYTGPERSPLKGG